MGNTSKYEPLTDQQRTVLEIERLTWRPLTSGGKGIVKRGERWMYATGKPETIRALLGVSEARYSQILLALLSNPAAEVYDPQLIHRLRRVQDQRVQRRATRSAAR